MATTVAIIFYNKNKGIQMALHELRAALVNGGMVEDQDPEFVADVIKRNLPGMVKRVHNGLNINCPMCVNRGEPRPDTKYRCGIRFFPGGSFNINCFNCHFHTRWQPGLPLSRNVKEFLSGLSVGDYEIKKLTFNAWKYSQNVETTFTPEAVTFNPDFPEVALPAGAKTITEWAQQDCTELDFLETVQYLMTRGDDIWNSSEYYWTPDKAHDMNRRLIVPFYWHDKIVGYAGRLIDNAPKGPSVKYRPKYYTNTPAHFLFNNSMINKDRKFIILVEGLLDALAIEGVATQGAKLSEQQAFWLNQSGKKIIVVPDRDDAGQKLIDLALEHDWMVSIPSWDSHIKDANDAVKEYGKLYTVRSIIDAATNNKLQINLLRKKF